MMMKMILKYLYCERERDEKEIWKMRLLYCSNNLNFDASFLLFFVKAVLEYFEFISARKKKFGRCIIIIRRGI